MDEKYTYQLQITTGVQSKELSEIARQVAEILPGCQWIEGTANILLANPDFYEVKTAVKLAGGEDFDVDPLFDVFKTETVEQFGIIPVPYKRIELEGKLAIIHEPVNAVLPPRFDTESDLNAALAQLLLGEVLAGVGEFEFRGQPMTLLEPLDIKSLPPAPKLNILESELESAKLASTHYTCLGNTDYIPGFPLLDFQTFSAIRTTEISWAGSNIYVIGFVYDGVSCIWQKITHTSLDWQLLNIDYDIPSYEVENLHELRNAYPELANLSDEGLYGKLDSYQADCCGVLDWRPNREEGFIFYLLGLLCIGEQANGEEAKKVGMFVAYQLMHSTVSEALKQGKIWFDYKTGIQSLVWRTRRIIDFLRQKKPNQGQPVSTISDFFAHLNQSGFRLQNR